MPSGAAASTITATANTLQLGISEKLGVFLEFLATIISAIVIAFTYSWELTLVVSTMIIFIMVVISVLLPFILKGHNRMTKVGALPPLVPTSRPLPQCDANMFARPNQRLLPSQANHLVA